jgi:hypothetical protein
MTARATARTATCIVRVAFKEFSFPVPVDSRNSTDPLSPLRTAVNLGDMTLMNRLRMKTLVFPNTTCKRCADRLETGDPEEQAIPP